MLILAGAVLVLAFLVAAFAVSEIAQQEAALEAGAEGRLAQTFQETRGEFAAAMSALVIPSTTNETLASIFAAQRLEFEERGRSHGLFTIVSLANATDAHAPRSEKRHFTDSGASSVCGTDEYTMMSYNLSRNYAELDWDCGDDGILYDHVQRKITGVVAYLFLGNEAARVEETFVMAVN